MLAFYLSLIEDHSYDDKFNKIYEKYKNYVYNVSHSILRKPDLAEEATQDAFVNVTKNIKKIIVENDAVLKSFLYILAKNCAIRIYNHEKKIQVVDIDTMPWIEDKVDIFDEVASAEAYDKILKYIADLPERYSDVMTLHLVNGFNNPEIAEIVNLPVATVKTQVYRGNKMLKEMIAEIYDNE